MESQKRGKTCLFFTKSSAQGSRFLIEYACQYLENHEKKDGCAYFIGNINLIFARKILETTLRQQQKFKRKRLLRKRLLEKHLEKN